jgi:hypothetical protein
MNCTQLDDEHPQWLVNEQIKGLLEGDGASEDHQDVIDFLRSTGLPDGTVTLIHLAIVGNINATRWRGFVKACTSDDESFVDMLDETDPETPEEFNAVMDRWLAQQQ